MNKILLLLLLPLTLFGACLPQNNTTPPTVEALSSYDNIIPVAIIGSGVAGLGAANATCKRGYHTVVFQGPQPRGGLNYDSPVKDWLGIKASPGKEIMQSIESQAVSKGAILIPETITAVDFSKWPFVLTTDQGTTVHALSLVIATGTSPRKLTCPGAEEYLDRGVYMQVTKKDTHWTGKNVVIVGGGDDAYKKAIKIANLGAERITLVVRGTSLRMDPEDQEELTSHSSHPQITIRYNTEISAIKGDATGVTEVEIASNGEKELFSCNAVSVAIGMFPTTDLFKDQLQLGPDGEILILPMSQKTSIAGITAAGTAVDPRYRKGFISASDGLKAGYDATLFLREQNLTPESLEPLRESFYKK